MHSQAVAKQAELQKKIDQRKLDDRRKEEEKV